MFTQESHIEQRRRLHTTVLRLGLVLMLTLAAGQAATFNIADGDVPGLIAAIQTANATCAAATTINLAPGGTYTLTAVAENPSEYNAPHAVGLPAIRVSITINGNGATIQRSTAPGTPDFTVLAVSGRTWSGEPSCYAYPVLTLNQTTVTGGSGGGLHMNSGNAVIQASTITRNTGAGGIVNACGSLTLLNSTVSYNSSPSAYGGGGIFFWGFSCAPDKPTADISFSTIFDNSNPGWGRGNAIGTAFVPAGSVRLKNSILASPSNPSEGVCNNQNNIVVSLGHNILGDASDLFGSACFAALTAPGDMVNTDPLLGPLANNGGPTPTHLPLTGSPAIDAVPLGACTDVSGNPVATDQRGIARPQGAACDIGSVEAVRYNVCLLYDPARAVQSGATYPIKLQLCDAAGNNLSSPAITLHASSVTRVSNSITGPVQDSGNANPDNDFRFDSTLGSTGGYIFNLGTKGLTTGSYNLNFTLTGDPSVYAAPFQVK
jgi:hypothetical protein